MGQNLVRNVHGLGPKLGETPTALGFRASRPGMIQ